jgi:hypothetical protein
MLMNRYVEGLQDKIRTLENQLHALKSSAATHGRRASDHERDHSAAAALSSLGRVHTPGVNTYNDTAAHNPYQTPDAMSTPLPIMTATSHDPIDNETYEWDEGGDEKELGTDAMGAASTRDCKPGFFGTDNEALITYFRAFVHTFFYGGD